MTAGTCSPRRRDAGDGRRGTAGRRLPPDRLAGDQRPAEHSAGHQRAGRGGHRQLGYRPNTAARALVTRRSGIIGIVGTNSALYGPSSIQRSVQEAARAAGYFVSSVTLAEVTREDLAGAVDHLRDQAVEGIVMIAAHDEALAVARAQETGRAGGVPLIVVEGDLSGRGLERRRRPDRRRPQATQHLLDLGHTEIDHVAGPPALGRGPGPARGLREAMRRCRARGPEPPVEGDWTRRERVRGRRAAGPRRGHDVRGLRRQRPDGHRGAARLRRGRPVGARRRQRRRASTTSPRRATSSRR